MRGEFQAAISLTEQHKSRLLSATWYFCQPHTIPWVSLNAQAGTAIRSAARPHVSPLGQRVLLHGRVRPEPVLGEEVLAVLPNEFVYSLPPPLGMPVAGALQNQRPVKPKTYGAGAAATDRAASCCLSMLLSTPVLVTFYQAKRSSKRLCFHVLFAKKYIGTYLLRGNITASC